MGMILTNQQNPAIGMFEHMGMGGAAIARVQGYSHQVGDSSGLKQIRRFHRIVFQHTYPIAGL
jgi:hypothetical protein